MKKLIKWFVMGLMVISMQGCLTPSSVDKGEEAVLVYKPWFFGHGGVDQNPVKTGLTWTAFSTSVERVNIQPYKIDEVFDDLITFDNNPVDFKVHITVQHIEGKTPILVEKFGKKWYDNNIREPFRASVRDFTKSHKVFEMTTNKEVTTQMEILLKEQVISIIKEKEIPVSLLRVDIGKVTPPERVIEETINTAAQKQRVKTQRERALAEKSREEAEKASASADKAYMKELGLTNQQYLDMKKLEIEKYKLDIIKDKKVDNTYFIVGDTSKAMIPISK